MRVLDWCRSIIMERHEQSFGAMRRLLRDGIAFVASFFIVRLLSRLMARVGVSELWGNRRGASADSTHKRLEKLESIDHLSEVIVPARDAETASFDALLKNFSGSIDAGYIARRDDGSWIAYSRTSIAAVRREPSPPAVDPSCILKLGAFSGLTEVQKAQQGRLRELFASIKGLGDKPGFWRRVESSSGKQIYDMRE